MANIFGTLAKLSIPAASDTAMYTVASGNTSSFSINLVNTSSTLTAKVRIGITTGGSLTAADYIEYDTAIIPNGVLERTGLVAGPLDIVYVRSDLANVTARIYGYEEAVAL
jgi:hypothetical protein